MRNWDLARFATVAEIGASLGVIISVIHLGIQIQGSNKQLRAQSYNATLEMLHKPLELIVQAHDTREYFSAHMRHETGWLSPCLRNARAVIVVSDP